MQLQQRFVEPHAFERRRAVGLRELADEENRLIHAFGRLQSLFEGAVGFLGRNARASPSASSSEQRNPVSGWEMA